MAWFTEFPVSAVKSTLARLEEIQLACTLRPLLFQNMLTTLSGNNPLLNDVKFIDRDPHWYTRRVKEAIQRRLRPNYNINRDNGIELPEAWMTIGSISSCFVSQCSLGGG